MNIIEQMYKEYGVKPKYIDACTVEDKYWNNEELANEYGTFDNYMNAKCGNQENCTTECSCAYTKVEYPKFTAEKQIELIKLVACISLCSLRIDIGEDISHNNKKYCLLYASVKYKYISHTGEELEDTLATLLIKLKPYIDNSKVKEILEK